MIICSMMSFLFISISTTLSLHRKPRFPDLDGGPDEVYLTSFTIRETLAGRVVAESCTEEVHMCSSIAGRET